MSDIPLTEAESYQALLRSLRRRKGFNLLFVRCSPIQADRIIEQINVDLSYKKSAVLTLDSETDNVYQEIQKIPHYKDLNILFIRGLETALLRYEEAESQGKILPSQSEVYGGSWSGVPKILGQLNLSRERFYENFAFAIVILLPEFALRYFIRRAPDFFDWRSGLYEFPLDQKSLYQEIDRLVYLESDFAKYQSFTPQQRQERLAEIKAYLTDDPNLDSSKSASLWFEKGLILHSGHEYEDAIQSYDTAIELEQHKHEAWVLRGYALGNLERHEEAIFSYDKAIEFKPDYDLAWNNRGIALKNLERYEEAILSYDKAIEFKPDLPEAWYNRGIALGNLGRYEEAIFSYDKAIEFKPDLHRAWYSRGVALFNLRRL